jgi:hypothetical protein
VALGGFMNNNFYYSQSSLGVFERCPKSFEYMYIDGIFGSSLTEESKEKIETGTKFHMLAERYFNGMNDYFYVEDLKLLKWMARLEEKYSEILNYKSEYEIKQDKDEIRLMAKYDLLIVEDNKIRIIDFKTNEKEYDKNKIEKNIQTKVYMFLLGENLNKIFPKIKLEDISMEYFQLNYPQNQIIIKYSEKIHKKNKIFLKNIIENIEKSKKSLFFKNDKSCENCRFERYCKKI